MTRGRPFLLAPEVSLALVSLAAIVGMHRLFVDGSYRAPLVVQAVAAHLTVALLRRAGVRLVPAALVTAAAGITLITWARFPETTTWLLPTGETFGQLGADLRHSWDLFGEVRAPAPVENGFVAAAAIALWVVAFLADWGAFRLSATVEALLPAATVFVFAAALGGDGSPVGSAALFAGASLVFVLLHRTANQERTSRWAGERQARGRRSLVATGVGIVSAALVLGTVAGPNLPGADSDAVVAWRELRRDEPTRVVLSPMVSLQTSLVDQANVEVFTVRAERGAYWRLTSLDQFDGEIWRSSYSTDDARGELPRRYEPATERVTVTQEFTIEALNSVWLPAAYQPVAHDPGDGQPAVYDERSSTLMVARDVPTSDGYSYTVTSQLPVFDAEALRRASPRIPDEIAATYLQLPPDFPERVTNLAQQITAGAPTAYDKAIALQNHLRSFTYDDRVGPGHSQNALETFLFGTRRGYCEQFAAAFAAMARAVGLPARVAVGFTKGVQDPNDPTLYRVRGVHAHAWAEVFLGEYGWVTFDPTPGRAPVGAERYLGVPEQQDTSAGGAPPSDEPLEGATDAAGDAGDVAAAGTDRPDPEAALGDPTGPTGAGAGDEHPLVSGPIRRFAAAVGVAAAAYAVLVPLAQLVRRAVRRRRARSPAARVALQWRTATEAAGKAGVALPASLTIAEAAQRIAGALPDARPAVLALARTMETLVYAEVAPDDDQVAAATRWRREVVAATRAERPWHRRLLEWFDVRELVGRRRMRVVQGDAVAVPTA
ncbi:MAG: DUF3488 and transglutaminase-like domain-containing protein [Thermoanaerobacterales bacterium]|nr:DUF3488 domain-containing protein [Thermoanaerobacterales bacterium]